MGDEDSFDLHSFIVLVILNAVSRDTIKYKIYIKNLEI